MAPLCSAIISGMDFIFFEFVAACGPLQTHFHTEAQTDSRDWRNPLRGSFICADRKMAKSSPFGGAGIEQSEMTERVKTSFFRSQRAKK